MRLRLCALLMLTGCATQAVSAPQDPVAQVWQGTLRCDAMPTLTTLRLVQPFVLTVSGRQASYQRYVRQPDSTQETEVPERGGGGVAADGALTLQGHAEGRGYTYNATYAGILPPSGGGTVLTGVQHWMGPRFAPIDRPCSITLQR